MNKASFQGSPYQLGFQHGRRYPEEIRRSIAIHCSFPADVNADRLAEEIAHRLETCFPEGVEELRGISDGSGLPFMEIVKLNSWEEIGDLATGSKSGLCTSIAFRSTPDGPIMGKTTDIEREQREDYLLEWIHPDKGYRMLCLGKVGTLKVEVGLNEKGLCIGSSSSKPTDRGEGDVERMTLLRYVFQYCSNVEEAVEYLSRYRLLNLGLNILLLDATGKAVVVEKGILNQEVRTTSDEVIYATNFYSCSGMKKFYDFDVWYYENSRLRYRTLDHLFEGKHADLSSDLMKSILRSHDGDGPICGHQIGLETFFASVMNPRSLRMEVTDGKPCENEFVTYELDQPHQGPKDA